MTKLIFRGIKKRFIDQMTGKLTLETFLLRPQIKVNGEETRETELSFNAKSHSSCKEKAIGSVAVTECEWDAVTALGHTLKVTGFPHVSLYGLPHQLDNQQAALDRARELLDLTKDKIIWPANFSSSEQAEE